MAELNWDRAFALEQAGDDEELLDELVDLFHDSSAADLARIKEGAANGDVNAMGDASHSIKGAAASLGIDGIRAIASDIEKAGRAGDLDGANGLVAGLEEMLTRFKSTT